MYKDALVAPLLGAWEFLPRPKSRTTLWEREWRELSILIKENQWKTPLDFKSIVRNQVKTIVVTSPVQRICFTNRNFENMTGYSKEEVVGRKPSFLQGANTCKETTSNIRLALYNKENFSTSILNYKKDGASYFCKVDLFPIFDRKNELVNFVALEEELENV